jgi:hypothetical protein
LKYSHYLDINVLLTLGRLWIFFLAFLLPSAEMKYSGLYPNFFPWSAV